MKTQVIQTAPTNGTRVNGVSAVRLERVIRIYGRGESAVRALDGVTISFARGTYTAVMGPSGSGKSTLLQSAAGLDRPSDGAVYLADVEINRLDENALSRLRRERIGFVFQSFNLVASLTAAQNITLPLRLAGEEADNAWLGEVTERMGLAKRLKHKPAELSGGQQQRVAIARALVSRPDVVFADEPTGALDTKSGKEILRLLREAVDDLGQTVVMVTHDPVAASHADRVVFLADGRIVDELSHPSPDRVADRMTTLGD